MPGTSTEGANGIMPARLTRPLVGFSPSTPHALAGRRTEPPVSEPKLPHASRAPTAAPLPLDEPHATWPGLQGLRQSPRYALCPVGPSANSAMFRAPSSMAPAASSLASTVDNSSPAGGAARD